MKQELVVVVQVVGQVILVVVVVLEFLVDGPAPDDEAIVTVGSGLWLTTRVGDEGEVLQDEAVLHVEFKPAVVVVQQVGEELDPAPSPHHQQRLPKATTSHQQRLPKATTRANLSSRLR